MSELTEEIIQQAILQAKAGDKNAAKILLSKVVKQEPGNARAWYLLSQVVDTPEQATYCLEQVLKIQPDNQQAKERLSKLNLIDDFATGQPEQSIQASNSDTIITPLQKKQLQPSKKPKKVKITDNLFVRLAALLVSAMGLIICIFSFLLFNSNKKTTPYPTVEQATATLKVISGNNPTDFIKSISEFEESQFCKQYRCIPASQMEISNGIDNAYFIGQYPVYNEFLIEIITENGKISVFGMTLDPRTITSDDIQFIKTFLSSMYPEEVDNQVVEFIRQNLGNHVSQICDSQSIQFGTKRIWVGMVGLAPTLMVTDTCASTTSNLVPTSPPTLTPLPTPTFTPLPTPTPIPTPLPAGSPFTVEGRYGKWQISIDRILIAETMQSTVSNSIEKAAGRFAILFLSVTNRGLSPDTFLAMANFRIQDAEGEIFEENPLASAYAYEQYNTDIGARINPDETKHVVAVYDISKQSVFYIVVPSIISQLSANVLVQVP